MGYVKTAMLMAAMTALFMGIGYLLGGTGGVVIAFVVAAGMNAFTWWYSDRMVLRMHNARPVGARRSARACRELVPRPCAQRRPADARRLPDRHAAAQRLCHRAQPRECRRRGDDRA